eukprot:TRINITY_DN33663_c0_g1_i1.p1 TRINITY_DN33663_c0_g1~~TRINITY_DN33663_c0_g1_i1.p1  ORF type:complete len:186 (-),score=13.78 TRINITY_DN33663_c0_g1_i1:134-691(-)
MLGSVWLCDVFFFKQKTAYEMLRSLVGSEMCIRDSLGKGRCGEGVGGGWHRGFRTDAFRSPGVSEPVSASAGSVGGLWEQGMGDAHPETVGISDCAGTGSRLQAGGSRRIRSCGDDRREVLLPGHSRPETIWTGQAGEAIRWRPSWQSAMTASRLERGVQLNARAMLAAQPTHTHSHTHLSLIQI